MTHSPCELCSSLSDVSPYEVPRPAQISLPNTALLCATCRRQINDPNNLNAIHWRALNENIWTENPAVKVLAWRMLTRLSSEGWAQELLHQLELEDELLAWAKATGTQGAQQERPETRDSNGTVLKQGDSVTLIKDLEVKGANFTAKRGTLVKNISLTEDLGLIEGRVNGTQIVLKTCFLKKSI